MRQLVYFPCLLLVLLVFSCHSSSDSSRIQKNVLRVNFPSDPPTLDPRKGGDVISSSMQFMLFEGLTRFTPESSTELSLAKSIDISPDGKTYTFHLRDSKWSDGTDLDAYDFEFAWTEMLSPNFPCPNANLLYPIKNAEAAKNGELPLDEIGISATDSKTFVVELENPTPYFLELTSFCVFFPVPHKNVIEHPNWADTASEHFVCNGPFVLDTWQPNNRIIVKKNEHYWNAPEVHLSAIHVSLVNDENTALEMYGKGEIDIVGNPFSQIPLDSRPALVKEGKIITKPIGATTMCSFNVNTFPFNNIHMRKAFSYAINRKAIVDNITQLSEIVATGNVPPILKNDINHEYYKDADYERAQYHFNKGLEELEIEVSDLSNLTFHYLTNEVYNKIAQALQQQWYEVLGVQVKLANTEFRIFLDKLARKDYQFCEFMWVAQYNDQMNILDRFKLKTNRLNHPGWENPEYIQLLDDSMQCLDSTKRFELLEKAERIFIDEQPITSLFHWNYAYLQKPYLKGVHISPIGSVHLGNAYFDQEELN